MINPIRRDGKETKMKYFASILLALALLALPFGSFGSQASVQAAEPSYSGFPTFSIVSVVKNTSVTIKTNNLPPNYNFRVRMGKIGTRGIGGTVVGNFDSGTGGSKKFTFDIPAGLKGLKQIAIRFDATSGVHYFAYNWFWNNVSGTSSGGYSGFPTFRIVSVVRNTSVTIKTNNLPPNYKFVVRMNKMGTKGLNGTKVATFDSGSGGTQTFTFDIPAGLKGLRQIAIRFDATSGVHYFAYNWFWNTTAG